jgi:hypothetical protein
MKTFITFVSAVLVLLSHAQAADSVRVAGSAQEPAPPPPTAANVEKLKADHPGLKVETNTPAEILAAPDSKGVERLTASEAVAYLKSGASK